LVVETDEYESTRATVSHRDAAPYDLRLSLQGVRVKPSLELDREALSRIVD
jgi:hypothetical protein